MEEGAEWELRHDESSGQAYYVNVLTGESSWEVPNSVAALSDSTVPPEHHWAEAYDDSGLLYYVNSVTLETSWTPPPELSLNGGEVPPHHVDPLHHRPSTAQQMDELNALLSGGDGEDDEEERTDGIVDSVESDATLTTQVTDGSEWMMFLNETDGVPYYYNHLTGECVWEAPAAFLEYHSQHNEQEMNPVEGQANGLEDPPTGRRTAPRPLSNPPIPVPITPEFEEKVKRAIETVSKTPVGSSRLLFVRSPTVKAIDGEPSSRLASRPGSSAGSARASASRPGSSSGAARAPASRPSSAAQGTRSRPMSSSSSPLPTQRMDTAADDAAEVAIARQEPVFQVADEPLTQIADDPEALVADEPVAQVADEQSIESTARTETIPASTDELNTIQHHEDDDAAVNDEHEREWEQREEMMARLMLDEAAIVVQCLVRSFAARRRVHQQRQKREAEITSKDQQQFESTHNSAIAPLPASPRDHQPPFVSAAIDQHASEPDPRPHNERGKSETDPSLGIELRRIEAPQDSAPTERQQGEEQGAWAPATSLRPPSPTTEEIGTGPSESGEHIPPENEAILSHAEGPLSSPREQSTRPATTTESSPVLPRETTTSASARASARRPDSRSNVPPSPVKRGLCDTNSGRLAILNVATLFPRARSPWHVASRPASPESPSTASKLSANTAIVRKPIIAISRSREQVARRDDDQLETAQRKHRQADADWRNDLTHFQNVYAAGAARHANQLHLAQVRELERQQSAANNQQSERDRAARTVHHSSRVDASYRSNPPWSVIGQRESTRAMDEATMNAIKSQLADATTQPPKFIDLMMRDRLSSLTAAVQRMSSDQNDVVVAKRVASINEHIQSFPTDGKYTDQHDPYWCSLVQKLQRAAFASGQLHITVLAHRGASIESLLHDAAWLGQHELVEFVVTQFHADVNSIDSNLTKTTPLHEACRGGHVQAVNLLLRHGAYIDATDHYGDTPLHVASRLGHAQVVRALVTAGEAQADCDQMKKLVDSDASDSDGRVLRSLPWSELLNHRNSKKRRALDTIKLPTLKEYVRDAMRQAGCLEPDDARTRGHRSNVGSASSSASASTKAGKKHHKTPKTTQPNMHSSTISTPITAGVQVVHAR